VKVFLVSLLSNMPKGLSASLRKHSNDLIPLFIFPLKFPS
jgi:hypothetical protein